MQLTLPDTLTTVPKGIQLEIWEPRRFTDDYGPQSRQLGRRYILICKTHNVIYGYGNRLTTKKVAIDYARFTHRWCHHCKELRAAERIKNREITKIRLKEKQAAADRGKVRRLKAKHRAEERIWAQEEKERQRKADLEALLNTFYPIRVNPAEITVEPAPEFRRHRPRKKGLSRSVGRPRQKPI